MSEKASAYKMTPGDREKDLIPIAQIVSDAFSGGQHVVKISQKYIDNCHYDFDTTRLVWGGDELIHHWGVWGYPMRLETITLKVAGIGAVVTREAYRQQGVMQRAATASFDAMLENGYDLSILRGRHYHKFGYRRAWNHVTTKLQADEIPTFEIQSPYRPLNPADMEAINTLYNQTHAAFSGTCARPTFGMLEDGEMNAYGWFDSDGKLAGYVRAVPTQKVLQCLEAAGEPMQCLAVLGELFGQESYEELHFFTLPHDHPVLQIVRRKSCIVENRYFHHTGWLVRIVNLRGALEKMRPLFEARLAQSAYKDWTGTFTLDAGEQQASLRIEKGLVQVTEEPGEIVFHGGWEVGRLLIGSDEPEEIIQQAGIECSEETLELVKVLFPNLHPMISHWDEF